LKGLRVRRTFNSQGWLVKKTFRLPPFVPGSCPGASGGDDHSA